MRRLLLGAKTLALTVYLIPVHATTLSDLENQAVAYSPKYHAIKERADGKAHMAEAASALADPKLAIGLVNVPTDSYELDQEAMTQKKISLTQMLPRGFSLKYKNEMGLAEAKEFSEHAENEKATVVLDVRMAWMSLASLTNQLWLLNGQKKLRAELVANVQKLLANGKAKQRDVLTAELQLGKIDEQLVEKRYQIKKQRLKLEKLTGAFLDKRVQFSYPKWKFNQNKNHGQLIDQHPLNMAAKANINASKANVRLAKAQYFPSVGINLSYGKRENNPINGQRRADFLSGMLIFELPIYFMSKQNNMLDSAKSREIAANLAEEEIALELKRQTLDVIANIKSERRKLNLYNATLVKKAKEAYQSTVLGLNNNLNTIRDVIDSDTELLSVKLMRENVKRRLYQAMAKYKYLTGE